MCRSNWFFLGESYKAREMMLKLGFMGYAGVCRVDREREPTPSRRKCMRCATVHTVPRVKAEKLGPVMKGSEGGGGSPVGDRGLLGECDSRSDLWQEHNFNGTVQGFRDSAAFTDNLGTSWGETVLHSAHSICLLWLSGPSSAPIWAPQLEKVPDS